MHLDFKSKLFLAFLVMVSFTGMAHSQEVYEYTQTVRDLGRGGVRMPNLDDAGATMFYNPAMLAFTKGLNWEILNFGVGAGCDTCQVGSTSLPNSNTNFANFFGDNVWVGGLGRTSMVFPNFGFAYFENAGVDILMQNPAFPTASLVGNIDQGFVLGGGFLIGPNLGFGMNVKRITRQGGNVQIGPATLLANPNPTLSFFQTQFTNSAFSGTGYGLDAGLMWRPDVFLNPVVSLCWQDIGYTPFYTNPGTTPPPPQEDNAVLGITAHQGGTTLGWGGGIEYRHINNIDVDISKKFNIGAELNLALIDIRAGFYQGWLGYGTTVDLWLLSLDAAYYSVERGAVAGQIQDTRAQVGLSFSASFDPNFNITGYGGKNHRLKERR